MSTFSLSGVLHTIAISARGSFFVLTLCFSNSVLFGQSDLPTDNYAPNVLPPSPEAASLGSFVDLPSNYFTGAVSKSIPVYTLVEGDISVPIRLSYHGSGFRTQQSASWVGLGWTLEAGGVVSRTMVGSPDNWNGDNLGKGYLRLAQNYDYDYIVAGPQELVRYELLKLISSGCYDAEPDEFTFNFGGHQGKFNFHWDSHNAAPENVVKVDANSQTTVIPIWKNGYSSELIAWEIYTADGFIYRFEAFENTDVISSDIFDCLFSWKQNYNSSWFLTEISNASRNRYVRFEYEPYTINDYSISHSRSITHELGGGTCPLNYAGELKINSTHVRLMGQRLSRIYSSHSEIEVVFVPGDERPDFAGTDVYELGEIQIKRSSGEVIKKFVLDQDNSTSRLTLRKVTEIAGGEALNPYTFDYQEGLDARTSPTDHWGFSPGAQNACDGSVVSHIPTYEWYDAFGEKHWNVRGGKEPGLEGSVKGMLSRITYPTGGFEEYTYELNDYSFIGSTGLEVSESETNCVSFYSESLGTTDQDCPQGGGINTTRVVRPFNVAADPSDPDNPIEVRVIPNIDFYVPDGEPYFGAGSPPSTEIWSVDNPDNPIASFTEAQDGQPIIFLLSPGDYELVTEATFKSCSTQTADRAGASIAYRNYTNNIITTKPSGGVRLQKVKKYDFDGSLVLEENYEYKLEDGRSSGWITVEPRYVSYNDFFLNRKSGMSSYDISCQRIIARASSLYSNSHLGYKRVKVIQGDGSNGSTVVEFNIIPDQVFLEPPYQKSNTSAHLNGLLKRKTIFNAAGEELFREEYLHKSYAEQTRAMKISYKGGGHPDELRFEFGGHRINSGHTKVRKSTSTQISEGEYTQITETDYDDKVHNVFEQRKIANHKTDITRTFYPQDYDSPSIGIQFLLDHHMYQNPVEAISYIDEGGSEKVTSAVYFTYNDYWLANVRKAGFADPVALAEFQRSVDHGGNYDASKYESTTEIDLVYDTTTDNVRSQQSRNGLEVVYVWGYNNSKPVFKVQNATQSDVDAALSSSDLSQLGSDPDITTIQQIWSKLTSILPEAFVTGFKYDIAFGVTEMIDQNGLMVSYEYDAFGRLIRVKENDKITSQYRYHYAK